MPGSKTNSMMPDEVKRAVRKLPRSADFVWCGVDEDDRPATAEGLQARAAGPASRVRREAAGGDASTATRSRRCGVGGAG